MKEMIVKSQVNHRVSSQDLHKKEGIRRTIEWKGDYGIERKESIDLKKVC